MLEMILQAFDLARRPFGATPDSKCFFATESVQAVLDELLVNTERGQGISILTGDAGVGKSLLCERVAVESTPRFQVVLLRHSQFDSCRALLQEILSELGESFAGMDESELRLALRHRLQQLRPEYEALLLIVDEAENVPTEVLEEIRVLADLADEGASLVRLILCGQWRLEERLTEREFAPLNQRVCSHVSLESLSLQESRDYVEFRLSWAGGKPHSIFTDQALQFVARAAAGLPRCLNLLADHCLFLGLDQHERPIEADTVRHALADMKRLPLHWNDLHDLNSLDADQDSADFNLTLESEDEAEAERSERSQFNDFLTDPFAGDEFEDDSSDVQPVARDRFDFESAVVVTASRFDDQSNIRSNDHSAGETSCFEFGGDEPTVVTEHVSEMALEFDTKRTPHPAPEVAAVLPVANQQDFADQPAELRSPADDDGLCITLSSPRRKNDSQTVATLVRACPNLDHAHSLASVAKVPTLPEFETSRSDIRIPNGNLGLSTRVALTREESSVPHFVEEIVLDHYAALQEPEFSGIIWTLARQTSDVLPQDGEPTEAPPAQAGFAPNCSRDDGLVDEPPSVSLDFSIALSEDEHDEQQADASYAESESDGVVDIVRPFQPSRFIDAIIPLINDVMDPENDMVMPENSGRSADDIESDLIDALTAGELDLEDELGSEVLDLCLETQAAIRQARQAADQSLESHLASIQEDDDDQYGLPTLARYDIVQPDEIPPAPTSRQIDRTPESHRERTVRGEPLPEPTDTARRPLNRLFSELRRRQRLVG